MALSLLPGLTPNEVGFLCEMEHVTVIPRQRLDRLELLSVGRCVPSSNYARVLMDSAFGTTQPLNPPFPASLPLWLALLLKRQQRANISPPPWLSIESLQQILDIETADSTAAVFSPAPDLPEPVATPNLHDSYLSNDSLEVSVPFLKDSSTARAQQDSLPYHWLELSHLLITHAADDFQDPDTVRRLLRDVREVRMSKLRRGFKVLESGAGVKINGVGGMEVAEVRGFVGGMVDGLRNINRSREEAQREREGVDGHDGNGFDGEHHPDDDYDDDEMQL